MTLCANLVHHVIDDGHYIYYCSRCGACYGCAHTVVEKFGKRKWRCNDKKLRDVIFDKGVKE